MISVSEASSIIQNNLWKGSVSEVPLLKSVHRVLGEDVVADRDFPPFNRVTMDGIAIAFDRLEAGLSKFKVEAIQAAGMPINKLSSSSVCMEVMTGAMLPLGADTVVKYEDLKLSDGIAEVVSKEVKKGDNIHRQGRDAKMNDVILPKGMVISSAEIPLLASVGKTSVLVKSLPRAAVISTGDELVGINEKPEPHQIRQSNVYALTAGLNHHGIKPDFFHLIDDEAVIKASLEDILNRHDLIILSGGVSKGKFDFIPAMLATLGIKNHFHVVKQRPGKPIWFGTGNNKIVFALPGNPVSTFMCFYKYVEPWLLKSLGTEILETKAILDSDFTFDAPLTYFLQVSVRNVNGKLLATPTPGGGSGDFVNLKEVDGFLELPIGVVHFRKDEAFNFISFRK